MSDEDALFQTIRDNPDDDAPRLIFADWLEENGQPERAEFIRVQVEIARLPAYAWERKALALRERELLDGPGQSWFEACETGVFVEWQRGFIHRLGFAAEFTDNPVTRIAAVLNAIPRQALFREFAFDGTPQCYDAFLTQQNARGLHGILCSGITMQGQRVAALSRLNLPNLRRLTLAAANMRAGDIEELGRADSMPLLTTLDLSENPLGIDGAIAIVGGAAFKQLHELRLRGEFGGHYANRVRPSGVMELARSATMRNLTLLDLAMQSIGDSGLRALAESRHFEQLEWLDLSNNDIGAIGTTGLEVLTESGTMPNLKVLRLDDNPIEEMGFDVLSRWPGLQKLHLLTLVNCRVRDGDAMLLARSPYLHPKLQLDVSGNFLDFETITILKSRLGPRITYT